MSKFLFKMPNVPEEFGVILAQPELRKLDFSALDYSTMLRACVEYIRTYFPNQHNDFYANNGIIMLIELVSYLSNVISQRGDILVDESFLPTAHTRESVSNHLALINQSILRATPASVEVEITIPYQIPTDIRIPAGISFSVRGPDGLPLNYEVFRAPGDFSYFITIPAGRRGIIGFGIEGKIGVPITVISAGGPNQFVDVPFSSVLDQPIWVDVGVSGGSTDQFIRWQRIDILERAKAGDKVFEVVHLSGGSRIKFGNNITGASPLSGQQIIINYRIGGGIRGRIGAGIINESRSMSPEFPASAAIEVIFRNPYPSVGGTDEESIEQAKRRAPRTFSSHGNSVTSEDYGILACSYRHPVFGSVSKAIGTLRTGVDQDFISVAEKVRKASSIEEAVSVMKNEFINRNIVELFVLSEGPGGVPTKPSQGLKRGLIDYFNEINVLTDEVRVFDGEVKFINMSASIIMSRNADSGSLKVGVEKAIRDFFDLSNFDMGTGFFLSNLYSAIQAIPGVSYVDIFNPVDDVIETNKIASPDSNGIGFNEVIALGDLNLKFYFEKGNFKIPSLS